MLNLDTTVTNVNDRQQTTYKNEDMTQLLNESFDSFDNMHGESKIKDVTDLVQASN